MGTLDQIAIFSTSDGKIASPEEAREVVIAERAGEIWEEREHIPFSLKIAPDLNAATIGEADDDAIEEVRVIMRALIKRIDECRIVVGSSISGLPYQILNRAGFHIFEVDAMSQALLSQIVLDVRTAKKEVSSESVGTSPAPMAEKGHWYCNLLKLQEAHPEVSSKMALRDLFKRPDFKALELVCGHVPPWFDRDFDSLGLTYTVEFLRGESVVHVMRKGS